MLNELLIAKRGAREAGIQLAPRHPDIKDARRTPTLILQLDRDAHVVAVRLLPPDVRPWTLRDGQHNSFPFIQGIPPLLEIPQDDARKNAVIDKKNSERRAMLVDMCAEAPLDKKALGPWPGSGLIERLGKRRQELASLENTAGAGVLASVDRFLLACGREGESGANRLLAETIACLQIELRESSNPEWCDVAAALLVGKYNTKAKNWGSDGAILIDAQGNWQLIYHPTIMPLVSDAMRIYETERGDGGVGRCGLTGESTQLVEAKFPQPNLPVLGQTYLFARNKDIPANDRYGCFAAASIPVGQNICLELAAVAEALTAQERKGITWRSIPGESPKQTDLLLAFVSAAVDAPIAGVVAGDGDDDLSEEEPGPDSTRAGDIAAFEKRTERVIEAIKARVGANFTNTPVSLMVLRKVDPGNRKVAYSATPTLGELHEAAVNWAAGERNVPPWFTLPVFSRKEGVAHQKPPHLTPLGLIGFARQVFRRDGMERQEVTGLSANEALGLFLDPITTRHGHATRRVRRVLRLVLARRTPLLVGTAHALHRDFADLKAFDRGEALRTVTAVAVLLDKLGRKEEYMTDTAFRLGQLLAAADVVHAGYCADVRGGGLPPSLLGNQVFSMAQTAPVKALAALCRRWKPYEGWARKIARDGSRADALIAGKTRDEQNRGWDIRKAVRHAREMRPLADALAPFLPQCTVDDVFRAELLLGYIAGLPRAQDERAGSDSNNHNETED